MRFGDVAAPVISQPPPSSGSSFLTRSPVVKTSIFDGSYIEDAEFEVKRNPPSEEFGTAVKGSFQAVPDNTPAQVGDVLRITYRMKLPYLQSYQSSYFVWKIQRDDRFELLHWSLSEAEQRLWITVKVKKNFSPVLLVCGAILALAVGVGIWLSTESIEKLITKVSRTFSIGDNPDTPADEGINLFPILLTAIVGLAVLSAWKKS